MDSSKESGPMCHMIIFCNFGFLESARFRWSRWGVYSPLSFLFYLSLCHSHFWPLALFRFPNTLFHRPLTLPTRCLYLIQQQLKTSLVFDAATLKQLNHSLCLIQWHMWPQFIQQLAIHPSTQKAFPVPPPPFSRYLSRYDWHQNEYFCCMLVTWVIVFISLHMSQETNSHLLHPSGVFPQQWTCHLPVHGLKPACVDRRSLHHIHIHTTCTLVRRQRSGFPQLLERLEKSFRWKNIVKWKILFNKRSQRLQTITSSMSHFWLRWFYLPTSRCDFSFNPPAFLMQFIRSLR